MKIKAFLILFLVPLMSFATAETCPVEKIDGELEAAQRQGLKIAFGEEVDWSRLDCGLSKEDWDQASATGLFCRKSNIIILRRGHSGLNSTKFHEFQHYKNNPQFPFINNQHPFDLVDSLFEKIQSKSISRSELATAIRIVLMILWDETQAYQIDIACSTEDRFEFNDNFVLLVLKESYLPLFAGIQISADQLSQIYWIAKETALLHDFENDRDIQNTADEILSQNLGLIIP